MADWNDTANNQLVSWTTLFTGAKETGLWDMVGEPSYPNYENKIMTIQDIETYTTIDVKRPPLDEYARIQCPPKIAIVNSYK